MRQALIPFFCALALFQPLRADSNSPPKEEGVIILGEIPGQQTAQNISFVTIQWVGYDTGFVTDADGTKTPFLNRAVRAVIYDDPLYYAQIVRKRSESFFDEDFKAREVVTDVNSTHLTKANLPSIQAQIAHLEYVLEVNASAKALLEPKKTQLQNALAQLSSGQVLQDGKWMTQQEADALAAASATGESNTPAAAPVVGEAGIPISFTTKDGTKYVDAKVTVTDTGLSVITADGGSAVAFDQLPDDLSVFPYGMRMLIREKRMEEPAANNPLPPPKSKPPLSTPSNSTPPAPPSPPAPVENVIPFPPAPLETFKKFGPPVPDTPEMKALWGDSPTVTAPLPDGSLFIASLVIDQDARGAWRIRVALPETPSGPLSPQAMKVQQQWTSDWNNLTKSIVGHDIDYAQLYTEMMQTSRPVEKEGWIFGESDTSDGRFVVYSPSQPPNKTVSPSKPAQPSP